MMISGAIYVTRHDGTKKIMTFPSRWQAEYYLHLIPLLQVGGNKEALEIHKAKLGVLKWQLAEAAKPCQ
jgi:hypothetical protein